MRRLPTTFLLLFLFSGMSSVWGQVDSNESELNLQPQPLPEEYIIDRFDQSKELLGNNIVNIAQDSAGFLWIASNGGLNRFDGSTFTPFTFIPGNSSGLLRRGVESVYVDREGTLWVGSHHGGGGLSKFNPSSETFTHLSHPDDPTRLFQDSVKVMLEDHLGMFWVGTNNGLARLDRATETFTYYKHNPDDPTSLSHDVVRVIYEDSDGTLWIGTGGPAISPDGVGGLNRLNRDTGTFIRYLHDPDNPASLRNNKVQTILEDSRGTFWVGTEGDGLHIMDRETGTFIQPFSVPIPDPCPSWFCGVNDIFEDQSGAIWVAVFNGGLFRYDPVSGQIKIIDIDQPEGQPEYQIWTVDQSRDGSIWVATFFGGMHRIIPKRFSFPPLIPEHIQRNSLGTDNIPVYGMYLTNNELRWIPTETYGLIGVDVQQEMVARFTLDPLFLEGTQRELGQFFPYQDSYNQLWAKIIIPGTSSVTSLRGIISWDLDSGQYTEYNHDPDDASSLGHNQVGQFLEDDDGLLWLATSNGLDQFDRASGSFRHIRRNPSDPTSLISNQLSLLYKDRTGTFWVGGTGGLNRMRKSSSDGSIQFDRFLTDLEQHDFISALYEDVQGRFWVGTHASGLYLLNRQDGSYQIFSIADGLPAGTIMGILEDETGGIWLSSSLKNAIWSTSFGEGKLTRIDPDTRTITVMGLNEGLPIVSFAPLSAARGKDGTLYFGGTGSGGGVAFNPVSSSSESGSSETILSRFWVFNKPILPSPDAPIEKPIYEAESITLSPDQNDFTIEYTSLDPINVHFQYRLSPHDAKMGQCWYPKKVPVILACLLVRIHLRFVQQTRMEPTSVNPLQFR